MEGTRPATKFTFAYFDDETKKCSIPHRAQTPRQPFRKEELEELKALFVRNPYPKKDVLQELASRFDRTVRSIQIWFQNRRGRQRKKEEARSVKREEVQQQRQHVDWEEEGGDVFLSGQEGDILRGDFCGSSSHESGGTSSDHTDHSAHFVPAPPPPVHPRPQPFMQHPHSHHPMEGFQQQQQQQHQQEEHHHEYHHPYQPAPFQQQQQHQQQQQLLRPGEGVYGQMQDPARRAPPPAIVAEDTSMLGSLMDLRHRPFSRHALSGGGLRGIQDVMMMDTECGDEDEDEEEEEGEMRTGMECDETSRGFDGRHYYHHHHRHHHHQQQQQHHDHQFAQADMFPQHHGHLGQPMARAAHHHHPHHPHHHPQHHPHHQSYPQQQQQHYEQYVYPHHVHGAMGDEEDEDGFEENPLVEPLSSRNSANSGTGNAMSSCKNPVGNYWNQRHAVDPRNRIGSIQSILCHSNSSSGGESTATSLSDMQLDSAASSHFGSM